MAATRPDSNSHASRSRIDLSVASQSAAKVILQRFDIRVLMGQEGPRWDTTIPRPVLVDGRHAALDVYALRLIRPSVDGHTPVTRGDSAPYGASQSARLHEDRRAFLPLRV